MDIDIYQAIGTPVFKQNSSEESERPYLGVRVIIPEFMLKYYTRGPIDPYIAADYICQRFKEIVGIEIKKKSMEDYLIKNWKEIYHA